MREKETYRDNLAEVKEYFGNKTVLSFNDMAKYLHCDAAILRRSKKVNEMMFDFGKQKRMSIANFARYLS
jgi:hypothetical protein